MVLEAEVREAEEILAMSRVAYELRNGPMADADEISRRLRRVLETHPPPGGARWQPWLLRRMSGGAVDQVEARSLLNGRTAYPDPRLIRGIAGALGVGERWLYNAVVRERPRRWPFYLLHRPT